MNGFLQQLPALIGVLVGTLGTILATTVADRARWRRSQRIRWDERRLEAYVEYARTVKEVHAVAMHLATQDLPDARQPRIDREEVLTRLAEAQVRRTVAWESVLLLGDAATVAAAREWHGAVSVVSRFARGVAEPGAEIGPAVQRANQARDRFYDAARRSLQLYGGSVAQSDWLAARSDWLIRSERRPDGDA